MDQQQKHGDTPVETIAKTVPGEFVSLVILLKTFLSNNTNGLVMIGLGLTLLLPFYARRVLKIDSKSQIVLMMASYLAWFLLLIPEQTDEFLMNVTGLTTSFKSNVATFAAIVLVFQFALPFLTKPGPSAAPPAPPPSPVPVTPVPVTPVVPSP